MITDSTAAGAAGPAQLLVAQSPRRSPRGPAPAQLDAGRPDYPDNSFTIAHLAVQLNITSTMDSDLQVNLVAPDGHGQSRCRRTSGGTGANFTNTIFDDNATIPIAQGRRPVQPDLQAGRHPAPLNGQSINGTWTLRIINPNADAWPRR